MGTSYWNYRLIEDNGVLAMHEVYYNGRDEVTSWTEKPVALVGESIKELRSTMEFYARAFEKPVLKLSELEANASRRKHDESEH